MDLALDEQQDNDDSIEVNGIKIVYDSYLAIFAKTVKIDFIDDPAWGRGFRIGTDYGC
ncbi:MAG: hypothetical protein KAK01_07665 [Candidatus Marinimicrobia bacterium]|nr:hypothetical protein [Candidatus Neomarinimicrobiota bacterium]